MGRNIQANDQKKELLQKIYLTGHRAIDHLTDGSPYQGEWEIFHEAVKRAIDNAGGIDNLDNKRNEVSNKRMDELAKKYGKGRRRR